jgi:hypothetical protein
MHESCAANEQPAGELIIGLKDIFSVKARR